MLVRFHGGTAGFSGDELVGDIRAVTGNESPVVDVRGGDYTVARPTGLGELSRCPFGLHHPDLGDVRKLDNLSVSHKCVTAPIRGKDLRLQCLSRKVQDDAVLG